MSEITNQKLAAQIENAMDRGHFGTSENNAYMLAGRAAHGLREPRPPQTNAEALALLRELNDALVIPGWLQPRVDALLDRAEAE